MQAARGYVQRVITQVQQGVLGRVGYQPHVSAPASIPAGRSATRNELLAAKGGHAVSAVASLNPNFCPIDEH